MNNFLNQIQKAKEENNTIAYWVYKARHCNQMAIWREGMIKETYKVKRDAYMQTARNLVVPPKCLRDPIYDENLDGPCSAGRCQWPECKPTTARKPSPQVT